MGNTILVLHPMLVKCPCLHYDDFQLDEYKSLQDELSQSIQARPTKLLRKHELTRIISSSMFILPKYCVLLLLYYSLKDFSGIILFIQE